MTISLFRDLKLSGWHSSIMTTFSVDPAFYDSSVAWRLRTYGCENNILLADTRMLARALEASPEAFRDAGRKYLIVPVRARGRFHPKMHLRLGKNGARLIVGSANATAAGWGRNKEVITAFDWARRSEEEEQTALGPLIAKAYAYLRGCLEGIPGEAVEYKLGLHRRDAGWLEDLEPNPKVVELRDGTAVDLVMARGDGGDSILWRYVGLIDGEKVQRLTVISAYWDQALTGLRELQRLLQPSATVIGLNPSSSEFPVGILKQVEQLNFIDLSDSGALQRFLHAKVFVAETAHWDHVLFGSANCSDDALGGAVAGGRNAETCVYRRLRQGEAGRLLNLDYGRLVAVENIRPVGRTQFDDGEETAGFDPGVLEIGKTLTWWPGSKTETSGSMALLGTREHLFAQRGNTWEARLEGDVAYPLIVRVRLADGRVSRPCIVQNQNALRHAAPGLMDRRLRSAFDRVLSGEEDIIDLAWEAQVLFNIDETEKKNLGRARGGRVKADSDGHGDMKGTEDFRKSIKESAKTGRSGEISLSDPGLLELLRIVLRGVMDVGGRNAAESDDDAAISAGESEDGEEGTDSGAEPEAAKPKPRRKFTAAAIALRTRKLMQAIAAFEASIGTLEQSDGPLTSRLAAQTNFIISLMLYACTYEHKLENGRTVRLMEMVPRDGNRDVFAVIAARLLKRIWVGEKAVVGRIMVDRRYSTLPDDLCVFIVMTRWAVGRALVAVMDMPRRHSFEAPLVKAAAQIFEGTGEQIEVAGEFESALMRQLDASLGFTEEQTTRLVSQCRDLMKEMRLRTKIVQPGDAKVQREDA